jgi:hypothetical protein
MTRKIPGAFLEYVEVTTSTGDFPDWKIKDVESAFVAHKDFHYFDEALFVKVAIKCCHNTTKRETFRYHLNHELENAFVEIKQRKEKQRNTDEFLRTEYTYLKENLKDYDKGLKFKLRAAYHFSLFLHHSPLTLEVLLKHLKKDQKIKDNVEQFEKDLLDV